MKVSTQYDPAQAATLRGLRTYAWRPETEDGVPRHNPRIAAEVHAAVDRQLAKRGFVLVGANPDFTVDYHTALQPQIDTVESTAFRTPQWNPFGGPFGATGAPGTLGPTGVGGAGMTGKPQVRESTEGTLLLDITHARSGQLVWRGMARSALPKDVTLERLSPAIDRAATKLLKDFPPAG